MTVRRRSAYADRLLEFCDLVFSDGAEFQQRGAWRAFFDRRIGPPFDGRIIFEIGCNDAELLANVAAKHPTTAFIGIDWKCRALHTAATRIAPAGLQNVALLHGRAQDVRRIFDDGEVDEIWIFHPEPCDKPQELRNRLMAEPILIDAHRVLRAESRLILKTDHGEYFQSVLELLKSSGAVARRFEPAIQSFDFWNDAPVQSATAGRCFARESTFFERRFVRKRKPIYYLELVTAGGSATTPSP